MAYKLNYTAYMAAGSNSTIPYHLNSWNGFIIYLKMLLLYVCCLICY